MRIAVHPLALTQRQNRTCSVARMPFHASEALRFSHADERRWVIADPGPSSRTLKKYELLTGLYGTQQAACLLECWDGIRPCPASALQCHHLILIGPFPPATPSCLSVR